MNADNTAFIGATGTVLSTNMFAYCENNPTCNIDPSGNSTASIILNIASMLLSYAMLFSPWIWVKIVAGIVIGVASAVITIRDYNNQVNKLKKQYKNKKISKSKYNQQLKVANFWKNIGLVAAGITVVCSILSIPAKIFMNSTAISVINALGFSKGMVLSRSALLYDLVCAFNHKPKYS